MTILIGPEGDFSIEEVREAISQGYESITLGSSRLRTETAGLMAVAMAQVVQTKRLRRQLPDTLLYIGIKQKSRKMIYNG